MNYHTLQFFYPVDEIYSVPIRYPTNRLCGHYVGVYDTYIAKFSSMVHLIGFLVAFNGTLPELLLLFFFFKLWFKFPLLEVNEECRGSVGRVSDL